MQLVQGGDDRLDTRHDHPFGDLELQIPGSQTALVKDTGHGRDDVRAFEIGRRQVDRHPDRRETRVLPRLGLFARLAQQAFGQATDQPRVLGHGNELGG